MMRVIIELTDDEALSLPLIPVEKIPPTDEGHITNPHVVTRDGNQITVEYDITPFGTL